MFEIASDELTVVWPVESVANSSNQICDHFVLEKYEDGAVPEMVRLSESKLSQSGNPRAVYLI